VLQAVDLRPFSRETRGDPRVTGATSLPLSEEDR
jgi:hypothetical protein